METRKDIFEPNSYYHVYNKSVGNERLFYNSRNYFYFMEKFRKYVSPVADLHAYCLIPNHFHFLIQIKENIDNSIKQTEFSQSISKQFSHMFNAYAQAINKQQKRTGSLFKNRFKHIKITSEEYLKNLVLYIHLNPIHHSICQTLTSWEYSSYHALLSDKPTHLKRNEIIKLFNDKENFKYCHQQINLNLESKYLLE